MRVKIKKSSKIEFFRLVHIITDVEQNILDRHSQGCELLFQVNTTSWFAALQFLLAETRERLLAETRGFETWESYWKSEKSVLEGEVS